MHWKRKNKLELRRIFRARLHINGTDERPRLAVFRSNKHIYAQIINDLTGITLCSFSTLKPEIREEIAGKKKSEQAKIVGENLAKLALERGVTKVVFDRHGKPYIGRISSLADGARAAGLSF
jgi:large subunit ribosomal protein L18